MRPGSQIVIVNGGQKKTVPAGGSDIFMYSTAEKTLPEGLAFFTVQANSIDFPAGTLGYQDAWAEVSWSCQQQGTVKIEVDLIPGFTFCVAANNVTIKAHLSPLTAPPLTPLQWPGANSIDVSVSGTYGHGYRLNRMVRTVQGSGIDVRPMRLARVPYATHVFARVSCPAGAPFPNSELKLFGNINVPTDNIILAGTTTGVRYTGLIELAALDRYAELTTGHNDVFGTLGYVVQF